MYSFIWFIAPTLIKKSGTYVIRQYFTTFSSFSLPLPPPLLWFFLTSFIIPSYETGRYYNPNTSGLCEKKKNQAKLVYLHITLAHMPRYFYFSCVLDLVLSLSLSHTVYTPTPVKCPPCLSLRNI